MRSEQQHGSPEIERNNTYTVKKKDSVLETMELNRDDILEAAALILDADPRYPDQRGERANHLLAKQAIRTALKDHGAWDNFGTELERQMGNDAHEVLDLLK